MQQLDVLRRTLDVLDRLQVDYAIVGSYASSIWGEPRLTLDIDLAVQLQRTHVDSLEEEFGDEFYLSRTAIVEAIDNLSQFNLIHPTSGNKVDFMLLRTGQPTPPEIAYRVEVQIAPDLFAYVASPEDVIISKLRYFQVGQSEKHLRDIAGMLRRSGHRIDRRRITDWAADHGALPLWRQLTEPTSP